MRKKVKKEKKKSTNVRCTCIGDHFLPNFSKLLDSSFKSHLVEIKTIIIQNKRGTARNGDLMKP